MKADVGSARKAEVCEHETSLELEHAAPDEVTARLKRELYEEVLAFQQRSFGAEIILSCLPE